jgi:hypothetical protein
MEIRAALIRGDKMIYFALSIAFAIGLVTANFIRWETIVTTVLRFFSMFSAH